MIHAAAASFTFDVFQSASGHPPRKANWPFGPEGTGATAMFLATLGAADWVSAHR